LGLCCIWVSTATLQPIWSLWPLGFCRRAVDIWVLFRRRSHVDRQRHWDWRLVPHSSTRLRRPTLRPSAKESLCYAHNLFPRRYRGLLCRRYRGLLRRPLTEVAPQVLSVKSSHRASFHKELLRRCYGGMLHRRYRGLLRRPPTEVAPIFSVRSSILQMELSTPQNKNIIIAFTNHIGR